MNLKLMIVLVFAYSCTGSDGNSDSLGKTELKNFNTNLLLGDWLFTVQGDTGIESWIYADDSTLHGISIHIQGNDTAIDEHIELRKWAGNWQYCALVTEENMGERICFKIKPSDSTTLECTNSLHEFPQTIKYKVFSPDSMVATVSGVRNDTVRSYSIALKRLRQVSELQ